MGSHRLSVPPYFEELQFGENKAFKYCGNLALESGQNVVDRQGHPQNAREWEWV